ncbi:DUF1292 domain-containing protein [Peribacillus psychrosaccharolyticus]|uniref:DUF1292 domain-containing protein n=1 Tax=Peribacillus psychrosaccharolyticus TaxID=1407 RepID=A0A974RZF6_PERPY|nr:DUF1292 domain-containing protein [Peribacillus psychrosaccharolyticus]MEC2055745.1 DUF1292 domain-containing protein [Peribacillus psychrosaccharolyticus]MED3743229.1 DUF1292 domain-containing protein [Peribacillus psychrosaccharolyticus]QQS99395.1 DUF1292 domain-containing protein [Peribacillus psychrosaccharolyticus]
MERIEIGDIFTLIDENDVEQEIEALGKLDVEGVEYIAAGIVDDIERETEEDIDIFFFKVEEDGQLTDIETDEEFEKVSAAFEKSVMG